MKAPGYRDIQAASIPVAELPGAVRVKVIAGALEHEGSRTLGPIQGRTTEPLYLDVELPAGAVFRHALAADHNALIYLYEGDIGVGPAAHRAALPRRSAGVLSAGSAMEVEAGAAGARFIVLAAKPIGEPIVQYGPFVMNTQDEIRQAIADYQAGRFGERAAAY